MFYWSVPKLPPIISGKKTIENRKTSSLVKRQLETLAKKLAAGLSTELTDKVAEELGCTPEQALETIHKYNLDEKVNEHLMRSVTSGAVYSKVLEATIKKAEAGEQWAAKLILMTNPTFQPEITKVSNTLNLHKHEATFLDMSAKAKELLGEDK